MNQKSVFCRRQEHSNCDRMLLSPTGALTTMALVPIAAFVLILLAMMVPLQHSFGSNRTLDFSLFADGSIHVFYELESDPLFPDTQVTLFGDSIENLLVQDENGFLLTANPSDSDPNFFEIETLGASKILINYDTYSLVSKEGKIWSFSIEAPTEFTLLMPKNSVIVGMTTYPIDMNEKNNRTEMLLPNGSAEITYFLTVAESAQTVPTTETQRDDTSQSTIILAIGGIAAAVAIGIIFKVRGKSKITNIESPQISQTEPFDLDSTLSDDKIREGDKEIIKFIHENGGQALESELRKKFLQPRTTMWRAVKRLERYDQVEIIKKDQQNLVRLKNPETNNE